MLDQQVIHARKIVEEYKKYNQNTIERVARRENSKTVYFERVQTDENASKFVEKLLKDSKAEKADKRLARIKNNSTKATPKPKVFGNSGYTPKPNSRRTRVFKDYQAGMNYLDIAEKYEMSTKVVAAEISKVKRALGITRNEYGVAYQRLLPYFKQGLNNTQIGKEVGLAPHTVGYHRTKYNKSEAAN